MPFERLKPVIGDRPKSGIVHLGLGAFFRAFGCVYIADTMAASGGDWGVIGVSLRNPATRDALLDQGWAYTSITLRAGGEAARRINVLNDVLVAPENPAAVLAAMVDPQIKIVTLTVTEKGYCHNPATGRLNLDHPDIRHDIRHDAPISAPGFIVRALLERKAAGHDPFTVLSCDNLPENGKLVRQVVLDMAQAVAPQSVDWIASECRFPSTMVDRITPATTHADIERVAQAMGIYDAAPVLHEPFSQWVVEDDFYGDLRPDLAAAGVEMVADVTAHEHMKLRMLNGTHSALAYTGYLAGFETIADTVADPVFEAYAHQLWAEITPTLTAPFGVSLDDYAQALLQRYTNPAIRHRTWQIAMDGSQKLPQRILATLVENAHAGRSSPALHLAVAAWMRYVSGTDEQDQKIDVRDPLADKLRNISNNETSIEGKVAALLGVGEIFSDEQAAILQEPVTEAAIRLWNFGAKRAVERGMR